MARTVRLTFLIKTMPKAAQIARYAPDSSLLGVTSLNSHTVSLIDRSFRQLPRTAVGHVNDIRSCRLAGSTRRHLAKRRE